MTSTATRARRGQQLTQQLQPLCAQAQRSVKLTAGQVAARPGEAGDKAELTGSSPVTKTIGIVVVAALAASAAAECLASTITATCGEPVRPPAPAADRFDLRPAVFDRDVLALDIAGFVEALAERGQSMLPIVSASRHQRNPITGIAACCARAASGHAAAAPPSSVMNSRRSHSITSSARASSDGGTSRPSALAVLRLMTSSILGRRLHRQVGRLLALEDAIDVAGRAPVLVDAFRPIGDQAAVGDEEAVGDRPRATVPGRQRDDQSR